MQSAQKKLNHLLDFVYSSCVWRMDSRMGSLSPPCRLSKKMLQFQLPTMHSNLRYKSFEMFPFFFFYFLFAFGFPFSIHRQKSRVAVFPNNFHFCLVSQFFFSKFLSRQQRKCLIPNFILDI